MDYQKQCKPVRLFYDVCVPKDHDSQLSPIILLHGTGALHSSWKKVNRKIAEKTKRKVFSIDLRNHGQSEWSEHNTLYDHEADLENFLSENGIKKCILIGHSLGGRIAMFFAMRKPNLIEKIVTEEIQLSNPDQNDIAEFMQVVESSKKIKMLPKDLEEVQVRTLLSRICAKRFPGESNSAFFIPLKKNYDGSYDFDFNLDVIDRTFRDKTGFYIDFKECGKFTEPVLVMYAANSPVMKVEQDEKLKEFFPKAQLCKFKTRAHVLHVDKPDEFLRHVLDFIIA